MKSRSRSGLTALLAVGLGLWGCAPSEATCTVVAPIVGGEAQEAYLGLTETLPLVSLRGTVEGVEGLCSGVLIDRRHVLSAGHCAPLLQAADGRVFFGSEPVQVTHEVHPELDLLLARLPERVDVNPIPVLPEVLAPDWVGRRAVAAGYGDDQRGGRGQLHFVVQALIELGAEDFVAQSEGRQGVCEGDSGGPLLVRGVDGAITVAGVLSRGSLSCRARGRYVRLDIAEAWLQGQGVQPEVGPCGRALGKAGRCFEDRAIWCVGGGPRVEVCEQGTRCGWNGEAWRCLAPGLDLCRGETRLGTCNDEIARQCVGGLLVRTDCSACNLSCAPGPASGVVGCR